MIFTKDQQNIIDSRNKNLLVSAGAGSGKTATLVEHIINLIVKDGVKIDEILTLTFTNAAAAEMKQKITLALLKEVEKAVIKAEIGVAPNNDGTCIRLNFPPLTEERRRETAKEVKKYGEDTKIAIRNVRRDMVDSLKKIEKDENLPEDAVKDNQDQIQKITDKYVGIIDSLVTEKEKEVMTV